METKNTIDLNQRPKRIMVFPCGSEIGLEIHHALAWNKHFELIGASSSGRNHGEFVYKQYYDGLPFYYEAGFTSAVNDFVGTHQIDLIFPANDDVQLALARKADELACLLISPPAVTCEICRSKSKTSQHMADLIRVPMVYSPDAIDRFPVFLKPDQGQGSEDVHLAQDQAEVDFYLGRNPALLVLEYLPGREYTIDCFTDHKGVLRGAYPRERARIKRGISVTTYPADAPEFQVVAQKINQALDLRGGWFFQMKEAGDGQLVLMEIGPRIAGSMGLTRNLGVNIPLLSVYDRLGMTVGVHPMDQHLIMDRALENRFKSDLTYQHVYLDLDDTLMVNGQINTLLIAFVYQCRNRGILVHLITRNPSDLSQLLDEHGMGGLFASLIQISPGEKKADGIVHRNAIFIDDSYMERINVTEALGIPSFDIDAVESLMDTRR